MARLFSVMAAAMFMVGGMAGHSLARIDQVPEPVTMTLVGIGLGALAIGAPFLKK